MTDRDRVDTKAEQEGEAPGPDLANTGAGVQPEITPPVLPQAEFIWKVHPYTNEYIRFADTKAAAVIAWNAALIGILFSLKVPRHFMRGMDFHNYAWGATSLGAAALLAFALLASAVAAAFWCVKPSLWSRDGSKSHATGFIFWEQVRAHGSPGAFTSALASQTPEQLTAACADHVYVLAGIAKRKYRCVDWSVRLTIFGSVLAGIVALFSR